MVETLNDKKLNKVIKSIWLVATIFIAILIIWNIYTRYFVDSKNNPIQNILGKSAQTENCIPYNVNILKESTSKVTIKWETSAKCIGLVKYGLSIKEFPYQVISQSSQKSNEHQVSIDKIQPGYNYYYIIVSDNQEYGIDGLPLTFSTVTF